MPTLTLEARARCRLSATELCAWNDRQPEEHRNPGPGEPELVVLERTADVCVYRLTRGHETQTTRRVREAPNRWRSERTGEAPGVGRIQILQTMTVEPDGAGSLLTETAEMAPLDRRGRRAVWVARRGKKRLEQASSRGLAVLVLEAEASHGLAVDPSAVFGPSTAAQKWWTRRSGVRSQYSPQHDLEGAGVMIASVVGSAIGAFVLLAEGFHFESIDSSVTAAFFTGAFVTVVGAAFVLAFLFDRWRTVTGVEARPTGVTLRPRRGAAIELPWTDVGLWGMRPKGERYGLHFRHPRFGPDCGLWLTPDHARTILASPSCRSERPPAFVLSALGLLALGTAQIEGPA